MTAGGGAARRAARSGGAWKHSAGNASAGYGEDAEIKLLERVIAEASRGLSGANGGRSAAAATPAQEWDDHVRLRVLVDELVQFQGATSRGGAEGFRNQSADFGRFKNWLKSHGVRVDNFDFRNYGDMGNGMVAVRDLKVDEVVVQIPVKLMMTTDTALSCPEIADLASDPVLQIIPSSLLALHLLRESLNPQSFWAPYIELLPRRFDIPLWYSLSELEALKGSYAMREAIRLYRNVIRQYWHICRLLKQQRRPAIPLANFTYEAFIWAVSLVMTRQNAVPLGTGDARERLALVPVWDMCNHEELQNISTVFNPGRRTVEFLAGRAFNAGEQVTNHYGNRPNVELLLYSGFVDPAAYSRDVIHVPVGMSGGPAAGRRKQLCAAYGIPPSDYFELRHPPLVDRSRRLLLAVYAATLPEAHLDEAVRAADGGGGYCPLREWGVGHAEARERTALEWLKVRCQIMMRGYAVSAEEDERFLRSETSADPSAYRRRCSTLLRAGERYLLRAVIDHIDSRLSD